MPKPPKAPTIDKKKRAEMEALFGVVNPETTNEYTLEEISAKVQIPLSTVGYHRKKWEKKQKEAEEIESGFQQKEPADIFEDLLERIPGIGDSKTEFAMEMVRSDPTLLQNPNELWRLLTQKPMNLTGYPVERIMKSLFGAQAIVGQQQQQQAPFFLGQGQQQQAPFFLGGAPTFGGGMFNPQQQGLVVVGSGPQGPVYGYPTQHGVSEAEVMDRIERRRTLEKLDNLDQRIAEAVARALPPQQPSAPVGDFEEVQEPVLDGNGKPVLGPDGGPLMRFRRSPIGAHREPAREKDPLEFLQQAKTILAPAAPAVDPALIKVLDRLAERDAGSNKQDAERLGRLEADLAAERVRREEAEKYAAKLAQKEEALRAAEARAVHTGLPPDAQILDGAIKTGDKHLGQVLNNMDKRQTRLEGLVTRILLPGPTGVAMPVADADVDALAARQAAVDAAETRPAPAAPPTAAAAPTETAKEDEAPPTPGATA